MAEPATDPTKEPQATRQYIFDEAQTRLFFIGSGVLMVSAIVGILLLASSQPKGDFLEPNRDQYLTTLLEATETLDGGTELGEGVVTIPIERAIELVAERGVADPFTVDDADSE